MGHEVAMSNENHGGGAEMGRAPDADAFTQLGRTFSYKGADALVRLGVIGLSRDGGLKFAEKPRPTPKPPMTVWPAVLRLDQAAEYCGLSVDTFKDVCPVKPIEFTESSKGYRWLKVRLDEWLLSLDSNAQFTSPARRFGARL
jgi:hypothetical protein